MIIFKLSLLLSILLVGANCSASDESISVFPGVYLEKSEERLLLNLLVPLFTYQTSPMHTLIALRPLFSYERDVEAGTASMDILYPLIQQRGRLGDSGLKKRRFDMFPLLHWSSQSNGLTYKTFTFLSILYWGSQGKGRHYIILLPFLFYARDAKIYVPYYALKRQSFFGIFPIWNGP